LDTLSVRRFNGPQRVPASTSAYTTILKQTLPPGHFVVFAKTIMGLSKPELSGVWLRVPADGELDGDRSTVFPANTATHCLQRVLVQNSQTEVRLDARA
jgi:hypothetical protein